MKKDRAQGLAVKSMNETAGPYGLSPMILVFGIILRISITPVDLPERERMKALRTARAEIVKQVAVSRIRTALQQRVPVLTDS